MPESSPSAENLIRGFDRGGWEGGAKSKMSPSHLKRELEGLSSNWELMFARLRGLSMLWNEASDSRPNALFKNGVVTLFDLTVSLQMAPCEPRCW